MTTDRQPDARIISVGDGLLAIAALAGMLGMKLWYRTASVDELLWILLPTSKLVSLISGEPFAFIKGAGFQRWDGLVLINKGCSGVNFFVIACSFTLYVGMPWPRPLYRKVLSVASSISMALCLTISANTARILVAMAILEIDVLLPISISGQGIHLSAGIFIYVSFLIAFYLLFQRNSSLFEGGCHG